MAVVFYQERCGQLIHSVMYTHSAGAPPSQILFLQTHLLSQNDSSCHVLCANLKAEDDVIVGLLNTQTLLFPHWLANAASTARVRVSQIRAEGHGVSWFFTVLSLKHRYSTTSQLPTPPLPSLTLPYPSLLLQVLSAVDVDKVRQ